MNDEKEGQDERPDDEKEGLSPFARAFIEMGPYLGIGWVFVASVGGLGLLGAWLDGRLGTGRKLSIAGLLLGILFGFVHFFRIVLAPRKRMDR